jgi:hypothetical protein
MKKSDSTKLKKKEVKTSLIQGIENTLRKLNNDVALEKVRKTIEKASDKISRKYFRKLKKEKPAQKEPSKPLALTRRNKNYTNKLKGKPGKDTLKEALDV